jgi:DNA-binding LytR/AlgR family response regulator
MVLALAGFAATAAAERLLPSTALRPGSASRILAVAAGSAVPMTFFVAWVFSVAQPGRTYSPLQLLTLFPFVALVQALIAYVASTGPRTDAVQPADKPNADPEYPSELVSRLPVALRRDIIALEAEDHYVRVHTLHGSALVLMRLTDAVAAIDPRLGVRVHRSWWVAKDGVRGLERTSDRAIVRLVDDRAVPISRTHWAAARATLAE